MGTVATQIGSGDVWYEVVFYLHILFAIIGLGTVFLNGIYSAKAAQRDARSELAVSETVVAVSDIAEYFIYAVFVTGLIMGITGDEPISMSSAWLSIAMLLFIIALGVSHGVLRPSVKKYNAALAIAVDSGAETPTAEMEALAKKVGAAGASLNLAVVVILYLMVWKPGL